MSRATAPGAERDPLVTAVAAFVDAELAPRADAWDREQALPEELPRDLGRRRWLVASLPEAAGGLGVDAPTLGRVHEEIGRGCGSVRNLVAVQGMVAHALERWAKPPLRERWLGALGAGESVAAFGLTEPGIGSDARSVGTTAEAVGEEWRLDGVKTWISFAQRADVFLVFARIDSPERRAPDGQDSNRQRAELGAFVVDASTPGLTTEPIEGLLGLRASELATVRLEDCRVPAEALLARGPLTFDAIAGMALDYGRFSTASGCVGLADDCCRAMLERARGREQFGRPIGEHQLVRRLLTRAVTGTEAARRLVRHAGELRAAADADAVRTTLMAKYLASKTAFEVASDAVQVHGAAGVGPGAAVQRHLRDAKVQEIIEGTSEIQELEIARQTLQRRAPARRPQ
ncbi:MAG: acyl-CoA dehydrogenase family protein [Acidobacteriota bacterium]